MTSHLRRLFVVCLTALALAAAWSTPASAAPTPAAAVTSSVSVPASVSAAAVSAAAAAPMLARAGDYCGWGANSWRTWMIPDTFYQADFSEICKRHDRCYSSKSLQDRKFCDTGMWKAMIKECGGAIRDPATRTRCVYRANTYYKALRKYAKSRYHGRGSNA